MGHTLRGSHALLVLLTAVGSPAAMETLTSLPVVSQPLGCTPLGPLGWAQGLGAAAAATVAVVNPRLERGGIPDTEPPGPPSRGGATRRPVGLHNLHDAHAPQQRI